jgi:hypothetical protein
MTDEEINEMPWKREDQDLTLEEYEWWVASRKEAGLKIDIETCELGYWYTCYDDAYGLREAKGDLPEAIKQEAQLHGVNRFVRSRESRGWVCEDDLPLAKYHVMDKRFKQLREEQDKAKAATGRYSESQQ